MTKVNAKDRRKARKRFMANIKAENRVKLDLVKAAHAAEEKNQDWPQYLWADVNVDAHFERNPAY